MKTSHVKLIGRSPLRLGFLLIPLALACFALPPQARAVCQEGCYGNGTALGEDALVNNMGAINTAIGWNALMDNTTGSYNTANGGFALWLNTTGVLNTATGSSALQNNTTGNDNTATGFAALEDNTGGNSNTADGVAALGSNTTGSNNTATGYHAIAAFPNVTTGSNNTAVGSTALAQLTTGSNNTANGVGGLSSNRHGNNNTANGVNALGSNTGGDKNTANGVNALGSNTTGSFNIALGTESGANLTTGDRNIDIGNAGRAAESNTIRIGRTADQTATFIAGISGATVANGVGVIVGSNGQLGTVVSSERFKDKIEPMDEASEVIFALKPVTFRYKHKLDPQSIPQFGLVAEQVEKVNPDLVARDDQGKPFTVRYEAVNAMLLNEFLKEHRHVQEQDAIIARQQKQIDALIQLAHRVQPHALYAPLTHMLSD